MRRLALAGLPGYDCQGPWIGAPPGQARPGSKQVLWGHGFPEPTAVLESAPQSPTPASATVVPTCQLTPRQDWNQCWGDALLSPARQELTRLMHWSGPYAPTGMPHLQKLLRRGVAASVLQGETE